MAVSAQSCDHNQLRLHVLIRIVNIFKSFFIFLLLRFQDRGGTLKSARIVNSRKERT